MIDRSISSLRTLRPEHDQHIFWFRDDLHQPCAISPMGMTTVQKHHAWGYHVAAEETQLPPSRGAYVKIHKGRVYLGFALIDDPDEVARRAVKFSVFVEHCKDHWDEFYNAYIDEVKASLGTLAAVDADGLTTPHLLDYLKKSEEINRRNWEIHFILMYPADTIYLDFEQYCKDHGIDEQGFLPMLAGFDSKPAETDAELWALAKDARARGLERIFMEAPVEELRATLGSHAEGRAWLDRFNDFLFAYGNRINAAHLDVLFPTWKEDPAPVLDTLRSYFRRMDEGWSLETQRAEVAARREAATAAFERTLAPAEKPVFQRLVTVAQKIYAYQEDHGFYIDQGSTAALHNSLMACGRRLVRLGLLDAAEDVFLLTFSELVEILDDISRHESVGVYHHQALVKPLVAERREHWSKVDELEAPLTLGNVPERMTDPIAIKVFGIVDDVLHPKGEKVVSARLEGFAASRGIVEGPARVVMHFEDFSKVQAGEILVCPYTGTAWTPLFVKIAGVVTDTGGMLTHAAIAAREYGIPAVVGTWNATSSVRDGDIVRIDGGAGVVEILRRAA
jgi:pyruvate,water dikinase